MKVHDLAATRSGDKGDVANVCVFVYDEADYELIRERLTVERVRERFAPLVRGEIVRYELPAVHGLNFVLHGALAGGVSMSLRIDTHGKAYASLMADIDLGSER